MTNASDDPAELFLRIAEGLPPATLERLATLIKRAQRAQVSPPPMPAKPPLRLVPRPAEPVSETPATPAAPQIDVRAHFDTPPLVGDCSTAQGSPA